MNVHKLIEPSENFADLRREMDSLKFCREVYANYTSGNIAANEHMDPRKAEAQLAESIDRVLRTWFTT